MFGIIVSNPFLISVTMSQASEIKLRDVVL